MELAYLVLGEQGVADAGQQHHGDQHRDHNFGRHSYGYEATKERM